MELCLIQLKMYCKSYKKPFNQEIGRERFYNGQKEIGHWCNRADVHAVGISILQHSFEDAGFEVTNLGVMVSQEEYISAAIETGADGIMVSSLYGHGELDCRGLREKCDEAGLKGILLYVGGNIVVGKQPFDEVEKRFKAMGFDRVFGPGTAPETTIAALYEDFGIEAPKTAE